jgi:hypothetical protein
MRQFIKLSNQIINTSKIIKIKFFPNQYNIHMSTTDIGGYFYICVGNFSSYESYINIFKDDNIEDFNIISKWISNIDFNNKHLE